MRRRRQTSDEPVVEALTERAQALHDQAAALTAERDAHAAEESVRVEGLRSEVERARVVLSDSSARAAAEAGRLDRAAMAYSQAADVDQRLSQLQAVVDRLGAEVAAARSEAETLAAWRDRVAAEVLAAADDEQSTDPGAAVSARARRVAAQELAAEAEQRLAQAEHHLVGVQQQHDLAVGAFEKASADRDELVQLASDILDGTEDERLQRQAELDARREAEVEEHRSREIARTMLGAEYRQALTGAIKESRVPEINGWRFVAPGKRG